MSGYPLVVQIPNACILSIAGSAATDLPTLGVHHDACTRDSGSWRFASRRLDVLYGGPSDRSGAFMPFPKELER